MVLADHVVRHDPATCAYCAGNREAARDIAEGRVTRYESVADLLAALETSSAAPEGAALPATRMAHGPAVDSHGNEGGCVVDCTTVIASALRDIYAAHRWDCGDDAIPDARVITFALCETFGWEYLFDLRVGTTERPSVIVPLAVDDATSYTAFRRAPENADSAVLFAREAASLQGIRRAPDDAAIERAAKAIYEETHLLWRISTPWEKRPEETRQAYRRRARAALAAAEDGSA